MKLDLFSPSQSAFESWWLVYPRKTAKGAARVAFDKAYKKIGGPDPLGTLIEATQLFAEATKACHIRFCPHPSTWLNQERWADDIDDTRRVHAPLPASGRVERDEKLSRLLTGFVQASERNGGH